MKSKTNSKKILNAIAATDSGEKKMTPKQLAAMSLMMKHARAKPHNYKVFLQRIRKLATALGYSLDVQDTSDGMVIDLRATYTGKAELFLPEFSKLKV